MSITMDMCATIGELLEVVSSMAFIRKLHGEGHQEKIASDSSE
jgi:hypothetical protein